MFSIPGTSGMYINTGVTAVEINEGQRLARKEAQQPVNRPRPPPLPPSNPEVQLRVSYKRTPRLYISATPHLVESPLWTPYRHVRVILVAEHGCLRLALATVSKLLRVRSTSRAKALPRRCCNESIPALDLPGIQTRGVRKGSAFVSPPPRQKSKVAAYDSPKNVQKKAMGEMGVDTGGHWTRIVWLHEFNRIPTNEKSTGT